MQNEQNEIIENETDTASRVPTTELQHVSFEQAKKLKELGFNWIVEWYYDDRINGSSDTLLKLTDNHLHDYNGHTYRYSAPSIALALKWFRDVKEMVNTIHTKWDDSNFIIHYSFKYYEDNTNILDYETDFEIYATYEEAEYALLDALIKYMEEEK